MAAQRFRSINLSWCLAGPLDHARISLHHHVTHAQRADVLGHKTRGSEGP